MTLSRWLFLTIPGFVLAAVLLALTIRSLLRTLSGAGVAAVPLEEHQSFRLAEPGPYDLYVEGRLGTMDFVGVRGALVTHILGLVVLGGLTIGSMVASGLLLFGPQR